MGVPPVLSNALRRAGLAPDTAPPQLAVSLVAESPAPNDVPPGQGLLGVRGA
jgi:hypothetical protein